MNNTIKQFILSPAAGKRMIAKSLLYIPSIVEALEFRTVVVIAGSTNGYVVEEFFKKIDPSANFFKNRFFRGITLPSKYEISDTGRLSDESKFPGDVVIVKGKWERGKTIFDVSDSLKEGDIIIKGANAINIEDMQAAVLIAHPTAGTISTSLQCVLGRRVELFIPVGLEKRISGNINKIALRLNSQNASGLRYFPISGEIITELQAIELISGAKAELIAGGGICGSEGSCWLAVSGNEEQLNKATILFNSVETEPNFII